MKLFLAILLATVIPSLSFAGACTGQIDGVWGYKGGRNMRLIVSDTGRPNKVNVIVNQENGSEVTSGTCRYNRNGTASLTFRGQFNSGSLVIQRSGYTSGSVSGYSFEGQIY